MKTGHGYAAWLISTTALICAFAPTAGLAQAASSAPLAEASGGAADTTVNEIVVTAEKHSQSVMRTSIAVSALGGDDLARKEIHTTQDLQNFTPSLSITSGGLTNNVNIRGIGLNATTPSVVSGVAVYRDNLFQAPLVAAEPLYDVANVQVLRGPQGTFVGSNSTGGALFVTTADPRLGDEVGGYVEAHGGSYDERGAQGAINLPISSTMAGRIAFDYQARDSFYHNLTPNPSAPPAIKSSPGNQDLFAARVGLLWRPNEQFSALLKGDYYRNHTGGFAQKPIPGTAFAAFAPTDPFSLAYNSTDTVYDERVARVGLELKYTLENGITLRSMSGASYYHYNLILDGSASTQLSNRQSTTAREHVISEEINILSPETGRFKWVVGAFYFNDPAVLNVYTKTYSGIGPATFQRSATYNFINNVKRSYAGFVGTRYALTDTLEIQAGARYTKNEVVNKPDMFLYGYTTVPTPANPTASPSNPILVSRLPTNGRAESDSVTWKIGVNWRPTPNNFLYAFVATGSKAGGIQSPTVNFAPEKVTDYEVGWKATSFDGALTTQVGAFYNDYTALQIQNVNPVTGLNSIFNAGAAKIWGLEGEAQLRLGHLTLNGVASYLNSSVSISGLIDATRLPDGGLGTLGPQCAAGQTLGCFNYGSATIALSGQSLPYSPTYTFSVGAEYRFDISDNATLTPRIDVSYTDRQYASIFARPIDLLPERTLVNLKLTYEADAWTLEAYATNVGDKTYPIGRTANNRYYGAPRQIGARVARRF